MSDSLSVLLAATAQTITATNPRVLGQLETVKRSEAPPLLRVQRSADR